MVSCTPHFCPTITTSAMHVGRKITYILALLSNHINFRRFLQIMISHNYANIFIQICIYIYTYIHTHISVCVSVCVVFWILIIKHFMPENGKKPTNTYQLSKRQITFVVSVCVSEWLTAYLSHFYTLFRHNGILEIFPGWLPCIKALRVMLWNTDTPVV